MIVDSSWFSLSWQSKLNLWAPLYLQSMVYGCSFTNRLDMRMLQEHRLSCSKRWRLLSASRLTLMLSAEDTKVYLTMTNLLEQRLRHDFKKIIIVKT